MFTTGDQSLIKMVKLICNLISYRNIYIISGQRTKFYHDFCGKMTNYCMLAPLFDRYFTLGLYQYLHVLFVNVVMICH